MDGLKYLFGAAILFFIFSKVYEGFKEGVNDEDKRMHCMTCGTDAIPKDVTRGHFAIEVILWLCFLVPGVIYSIWRMTTKTKKCSACGAPNLVPYSAPAAVQHRKTLQS